EEPAEEPAEEAAAAAGRAGPAVAGEPAVAAEPAGGPEPTGEPAVAGEPAPAPSPYELVLTRLDELLRLRRHDVELVDRLHSDNTRLRQGELAEAMAPLLRGLLRLHDQMTSLGADDPHSVAGILRNQLL
ncbi:MAG TPA: hypothetical protein VKP11_11390, partial [Frankiaceae bacterium]|nr:hypothetical protein [Frankiaceae bacterium]